MQKTYRGIVAANWPAYGHIEIEAADDFSALLTVLSDFDHYSMDTDGDGFEHRIVELLEVTEDGTEREIATDWLISESERAFWDKAQAAMAKPPTPTESETLAKAFAEAHKPVCRHCGCTEITAEAMGAVWCKKAQTWELTEICDKGHYCGSCDGEARIDWEIVI